MSSLRALAPALLLLFLVDCRGGALPEVVDARRISGGGRPRIEEIIDLGAVSVPRSGPLQAAHRDGRAVIGELLLLQGTGFGKQPTVSIGGRPAAVVGRVEGGGLVARVPWGIDPGEVEVEVSTAAGQHARRFPVRRIGLVSTGQSVWPFSVTADGNVAPGQPIALRGAEQIALSPDGAAAYLGGDDAGPVLSILDLAAPEPALAGQRRLRGKLVLDLVTAEQAPLGVALTDTHLQLFETNDQLRPSFYAPWPLPATLTQKRILAAALGGQGGLLVLLLASQNQVALIDLRDRARPGTPVFLEVLPGTPLSLVQDLSVSADEGSIWVVSGDTPRSIDAGFQPLRVSLIEVRRPATGTELALHRTWELGDKRAPRQLAVARGEPIPPGTVIRPEPSTSAVYLALAGSHWIKPGLERQPEGLVLRTALGKGGETLLGDHLITSLDVVGKTQILLALGAQGTRPMRRVLLSRRAWEKEAPRTVQLGSIDGVGTPPWLGEVRAQP